MFLSLRGVLAGWSWVHRRQRQRELHSAHKSQHNASLREGIRRLAL
ncbi:hypothetical protein [Pseudarthrobacter sp. AB1]|nr:hypothetical protein [Pseudarthrobacter sp. AB1]